MGFHRNQQTLSLIPWGVPKSETLKSHHRRRGCVLGQGATKKLKEGKGKEGKRPHTTWQIRRWFAVDNLYPETDRNCRDIPGSARRKWPAATRSDVMRFTEYSTPWLVCASDLEIKSKRKYRQWAQKLDAAKLLGFVPTHFHDFVLILAQIMLLPVIAVEGKNKNKEKKLRRASCTDKRTTGMIDWLSGV